MIKIAIIGKQCSGKSSAAKAFIDGLQPFEFEIAKFASPIYLTLEALGQEKHRAFMQEFGDLAKKHFGELIFVELFKNEIRVMTDFAEQNGTQMIVCDDIRRECEVLAARQMGFKILFIDAAPELRAARAAAQGLAFIENHNSETEVNSLKKYAEFIINDMGLTINELRAECRVILGRLQSPQPTAMDTK